MLWCCCVGLAPAPGPVGRAVPAAGRSKRASWAPAAGACHSEDGVSNERAVTGACALITQQAERLKKAEGRSEVS